MGAFLLAAGEKGKRYCLPNSQVMIHQPSGGAQGQATDILIQAENIKGTKDRLNRILAKHTGKEVGIVEADTERDNFMDSAQALAYGMVDEILERRPV